jgi:hypothetical protein
MTNGSLMSDVCLPAPAPFGVKKAAFWGVSARMRAHTPKCGGLSRKFLKNLTNTHSECLQRPGIRCITKALPFDYGTGVSLGKAVSVGVSVTVGVAVGSTTLISTKKETPW